MLCNILYIQIYLNVCQYLFAGKRLEFDIELGISSRLKIKQQYQLYFHTNKKAPYRVRIV